MVHTHDCSEHLRKMKGFSIPSRPFAKGPPTFWVCHPSFFSAKCPEKSAIYDGETPDLQNFDIRELAGATDPRFRIWIRNISSKFFVKRHGCALFIYKKIEKIKIKKKKDNNIFFQ